MNKTKVRMAATALAGALLLSMGSALVAYGDDGGRNNNNNGNNNNNNNQNAEVRLRTRLAGAAISDVVPAGNAEFRSRPDRGRMELKVEVEHVNLAANTMLTVTVKAPGSATAMTVGMITLGAGGRGELDLNSQDGDSVPVLVTGTMVTVSNGATPVLSGVF